MNPLEEAVTKQAANLEPAQREFVLDRFRTYKWNEDRITALEKELEDPDVDEEGRRDLDYEGKLFRQRHQLVAEQASLFSHIMRQLKGTGDSGSELDEFM